MFSLFDFTSPFYNGFNEWSKMYRELCERIENDMRFDEETKPCKKDCGKDKCEYHSEVFEDGKLKERVEKKWENGKLIKDEYYNAEKALGDGPEFNKFKAEKKKLPENCCYLKNNKVKIDAERYEQLVKDASAKEKLEKDNRCLVDEVERLNEMIADANRQNQKLKKQIDEIKKTLFPEK